MILHRWGELPYPEAMKQMEQVHKAAKEDGQNHLILTQHPPCFTVGQEAWQEQWDVPVYKSNRGGSVTCHAPGQNIYYFCFHVKNPPLFFRKVQKAFSRFFHKLPLSIHFDKHNPGFYIQNRKLCSLGFRYKEGVSLHGVSLNVDVDLDFFNQLPPCNLQGITATSLFAEGVKLLPDDVDEKIVTHIAEVFDDPL